MRNAEYYELARMPMKIIKQNFKFHQRSAEAVKKTQSSIYHIWKSKKQPLKQIL